MSATAISICLEAVSGSATKLEYLLSGGEPTITAGNIVIDPDTGQPALETRRQTPAEITPDAELLQSKAQVSAIGVGATTDLPDLIDNTGGSEIVTDVDVLGFA